MSLHLKLRIVTSGNINALRYYGQASRLLIGPAILLAAGAYGSDDDPAAFKAEGDFAASGDTGRQTYVFGDGDLALF